MRADESLWPSAGSARGLTSGTFYGNLRRYLRKAGLPLAGVHIFRHSAAKLRRDVGESIEDVSRFLDHSSLAVTTTYLRRLEGQEDQSWGGWRRLSASDSVGRHVFAAIHQGGDAIERLNQRGVGLAHVEEVNAERAGDCGGGRLFFSEQVRTRNDGARDAKRNGEVQDRRRRT